MVNHVKLEIAIQIVAEKISDIYQKIEQTKNSAELEIYKRELIVAYDERDKVAVGDYETIEKVLKERSSR